MAVGSEFLEHLREGILKNEKHKIRSQVKVYELVGIKDAFVPVRLGITGHGTVYIANTGHYGVAFKRNIWNDFIFPEMLSLFSKNLLVDLA